MTEELKPCPFCGGKPIAYDMLESLSICTVECSSCDITVEGRTTEATATKWNTRALTQRPEAQEGEAFESVLIDGVAYDLQAPVAAELLRLHLELQARASLPTQPAAQAAQVPDVLFDGFAVLQGLSEQAKKRTGAENVSDVLDSVVRLIRAAQQGAEQAKGER